MTCDRCTAPSIYSPCGPCQIVAASEDADLYRAQKASPIVPTRPPGLVAASPLWERDIIPDVDPAWWDTMDPVGQEACQ